MELKLKKIDEINCVLEKDYNKQIGDFIIKVPKDFKTDGASIPLILRPFFARYGKNTEAAIIHDYLYSEWNDTGINRTLADKIFYKILRENKVSKRKAYQMYKAVRIFGQVFWKKKLNNEGYKDRAIIDKTDEAINYYKKWKEKLKL